MDIEVLDSNPSVSAEDRKLVAWIEQHIGGTVERCERQPRWRPGWWVDMRRDGKLISLYARGERAEEYPPWPIEHEAGAIQILEKHGIPVPHVYGICEDPHAIVMESVPGRTDLGTAKDDAERLSVLNHFAEVMARMHAIDPAELLAIGATMPSGDRAISLPCYDLCDSIYLNGKKAPDPRVEFLRRWVESNIPKNRKKISILAVDSAQFLFKDGKVTALFDFEYACLGDPMVDVAMMPLRAGFENMGDCRPFFRRYAELTGAQFEPATMAFHVVWWMLCNPLIISPGLPDPAPDAAYVDHVSWYSSTLVVALEALADLKGLKLEKNDEFRTEHPSRWAKIFNVMKARLPQAQPDEAYEATQQRAFLEFIRRVDAFRDIEDDYLKQAGQLLGHPVHDWQQADRELESFVLAAGPEHEDTLIRMFYRWARAQTALVNGIAGYLPNGPTVIQPFSEILS